MKKKLVVIISMVLMLSIVLYCPISAKQRSKMMVAMPNVYVVEPKTSGFNSANKEAKYPMLYYIPSAENNSDIYSALSDNQFDLRLSSAISDDADFPFYVVVPKNIDTAIDEIKLSLNTLAAYYPIDTNRVYVSGYKDGADKALQIASECADKLSGYIITEPTVFPGKDVLEKLNLEAGWIFTDYDDTNKKVIDETHQTIMSFRTGKVNSENAVVPVNVVLTEFASKTNTTSAYFDDNVLSFMLRFPEKHKEGLNLGTPNGTSGSVIVNDKEMKYFLRFPRGDKYPKDGKGIQEKMPLIVDLHGSGGESAVEGMMDGTWADYGIEHLRTNVNCDYFRVFPRLPEWGYMADGRSGKWGSCAEHIKAMIEKISKEYNIDTDRIYLTGFSLGGYGTWSIACQMPDIFAAIAPCAGDVADLDQLYKIAHIPVHIYHGKIDPVVSYAGAVMPFYRLNQLGAHVTLTTENDGHVLSTIMRSEGAADWLLQFKKGDIVLQDIALIVDLTIDKLVNTQDIISGKTLPYVKVIVRKNGEIVGSERADDTGEFVILFDKLLKEGDKYTLSVIDLYGNETQQTEKVVIDKKGPSKIKKLNVNIKKRTIKGVTEKNATVCLINNKGKVFLRKKIGKKTKFTIRLKRTIVKKYFKSGKIIKIYAVDTKGNKGKKTKLKFKV